MIYVPWAVWGSQWQFALDDLHAEIALADGDEEPEGAWLRPRGLGVDPEIGPGSASVDVERLPSGEEADMTAVFPRSAVSSVEGAQVEAGDGLEKILAEEEEIDDDQGLISKAAAFVGANVIPVEIVWTILVLLGAAIPLRPGARGAGRRRAEVSARAAVGRLAGARVRVCATRASSTTGSSWRRCSTWWTGASMSRRRRRARRWTWSCRFPRSARRS